MRRPKSQRTTATWEWAVGRGRKPGHTWAASTSLRVANFIFVFTWVNWV